MPSTWLISDPHFGHHKTCTTFKRKDGSPLRPFADADEMDEVMVARWNDRVRPNDNVYMLGDIAIARKSLSILHRLNGTKTLIRGNHDIFKLEEYAEFFKDVRGCHVMNGMILTHIPIHPQSLARFGCNIHGHLHANRVMKPYGVNVKNGQVLYSDEIDVRYFNVSVEQIDFAPILFEECCKAIVAQGGTVGFREMTGAAEAD